MKARSIWRPQTRRSIRLPLVVGVLAAASLMVAVTPAISAPRGGLKVSPTAVQFADTPSGTTYPDNYSFAEVTITNRGGRTQLLTTASAAPPFWPTYAGTCSSKYGYHIPAHTSCTLQFGFNPQTAGSYSTVATIYFGNSAELYVTLTGTGT